MKRNAFYALLLSLLALGCQQKETSKDFAFDTHQGRRCFVVLGSNEWAPDNSVVGLENSYNLAWPKTGMLTPEAERELIVRCFGDSLSTTFDEATCSTLPGVTTRAMLRFNCLNSRLIVLPIRCSIPMATWRAHARCQVTWPPSSSKTRYTASVLPMVCILFSM